MAIIPDYGHCPCCSIKNAKWIKENAVNVIGCGYNVIRNGITLKYNTSKNLDKDGDYDLAHCFSIESSKEVILTGTYKECVDKFIELTFPEWNKDWEKSNLWKSS